MTRVPGIRRAVPLLALAIVLPLWFVASATLSQARQEGDLAPIEIGAGPVREQALGFTGRNLYSPDSVELFGYLTGVIGLEQDILFTDASAAASPSPQTARFTYAGSVTIASRSDRADITTTSGDGTLRVYVNDAAGASWDDPGSFAAGEPVAEYSIHLLDTLQRQAPGVGVLVGDGQLTQQTAAEISLDGERYRFGAAGLAQRLRYVGSPLSGETAPGALAVGLTGSASVIARDAIAVNVGAPVATPAAATAVAQECPDLQPWLSQTQDVLNQARTLGTGAGMAGDLAALDADTVRDASEQVATLGQTQRESEAPEDAVTANRLVVTALSTYARGLEVVANAASAQDADLLAQGQSVLVDGDQLLQRAAETVNALTSACAEQPA
jgi:voltage-gated potassium channel Kch